MDWAEVCRQLDQHAYREVADRAILNRRPWIFASDGDYGAWQALIRDVLGAEAVEIRIVGSAATGFSLSPLKPGRPFRALGGRADNSDIDLAVISPQLFEGSWNALITYDREIGFGGSDDANRMRMGVYNGFITSRAIPRSTPASRWFTKISAAVNRVPPFRGYPLRFRAYRRMDDLRAYHVHSLRQLHATMQR
jgi:hypothetical protein